jgi:hypothetical protein
MIGDMIVACRHVEAYGDARLFRTQSTSARRTEGHCGSFDNECIPGPFFRYFFGSKGGIAAGVRKTPYLELEGQVTFGRVAMGGFSRTSS